MTPEYSDFLAHYGVKGQKWGTRQWQNADGTYTEAGKIHYGWGQGQQNNGYNGGINPGPPRPPSNAMGSPRAPRRPRNAVYANSRNQTSAVSTRRTATPEEIAARKARTKKIIAIGAGVAVAAAISYGAYKGSTKLRDEMRDEVYRNFDTDPSHLHTLTSKYWDSADRKKYAELTAQRAKDVSSSITRRDAVAKKFYEKTGLRVNLPQSRSRVLDQRRSEINYSNFIRDAEKRGHMNMQVHDARVGVKKAQARLDRYKGIKRMGISKQYEQQWEKTYAEQVEAAKERLDNLLKLRRAG